MIKLVAVKPEEKAKLHSINQKYLYEMTAFYPDEMDENGELHYGYFEDYFVDPKRQAFFLYHGDTMVGFAMMHPYSVVGGTPDYTMAEFTIFPSYRRRHFAAEAAQMMLRTYRGQWEIKYNEKNLAAKRLWTSVTAPYAPHAVYLNDCETVLEFSSEQERVR